MSVRLDGGQLALAEHHLESISPMLAIFLRIALHITWVPITLETTHVPFPASW